MGLFGKLFGGTKREPGMPPEDSPLWARGRVEKPLLKEWRWLIGDGFTPILCTALGDLFLQNAAGAVFRLDVETGAFRSVARDAESLDTETAEASFDEWWKPKLFEATRKRTRPLGPGECYSWGTSPGLGGKRDPSNLTPRRLDVHFDALGRAYAQRGGR